MDYPLVICHIAIEQVEHWDRRIVIFLVGGLEHVLLSIIYGIILPLTNIFQDG